MAERLASVLRGDLPDLQRGLLGDRRRRLDAAGPVRGGAAARPGAGRVGAGRTRGARAGRADGDPGVPVAGPDRAGRRAGPAARPGPAALGSAADPPGARVAGPGGVAAGARSARTPCRPRSPRVMPGRRRSQDTDWARIAALYERARARCGRRRWSSSTGRSRSAWPRDRPPAWPSSTRCPPRATSSPSYPQLAAVRGDLLARLGRDGDGQGRVRAAAS